MTPEDVISYSNPNSALITPLGLMNPDRFGKHNNQEEIGETIELQEIDDDYLRDSFVDDGTMLVILIISLILLFLWGMVLKNDD